jgi:hypothetical protein
LSDFSEKRKVGLSHQFQYNIEFFLNYIHGLHQKLPKATRWGNYYSETVLGNEYLANKQKALLEIFEKISSEVTIGIDLGASNGLMAETILSNYPDKKFVCIEADAKASKNLYSLSKKSNIVPIYNSVYSLSPEVGFSGSIQSLSSRLSESADVVMALGLVHHLMHEENLPFKKILEFLFSLIKPSGYIIVEFVGSEDPRCKLISNPNYPFSENIVGWENYIAEFGTIIEKVNVTSDRVLYLIKSFG